MILIPYGNIFHAVEHLTEPKHFLVAWSLYNLFDDKVLNDDTNSYLDIKRGGALQKRLNKSLCASEHKRAKH